MPAAKQELLDTPSRLFLLDGMALLYRAHFALIRSPRFTTGGLCTSGIFGMLNTVLDLIKREEPTHLAIAFDTAEPTARHEAFADYKATREEMPEDLAAQLPYIDRLMEALKIPALRLPGYEADDVIGTLAKRAAADGFEAWMVTPDKDFDQLVEADVSIYRPGRKGSEFEKLGVAEVLKKWDIERVDQVIEILALMGDTSDNVPGIPGIGPKTAQKLIAKYGSVEELLAHVDELKGKQQERVREHADMARLSKQLVTIQCDVPIDVDFESLRWEAYDEAALKRLLAELEFDTLGKRLFGRTFSSAANRAAAIREKREQEIQASLFDEPVEEKTLHDVPHEYLTVTTAAQRRELVELLAKQKSFCFDTETTDLDPHQAALIGLAFAVEPQRAYFVVCPEDPDGTRQILEEFRPLFENDQIEKVGHNLKYDTSVLKWHGIDVRGPLFDTLLAHSMKEPEIRHGLDYLAGLYLGYKPIPTSALIGEKGKEQKSMREVPLARLAEYACEDADITLQVVEKLRPEIEQKDVNQVCREIEFPLIPVLVEMEHEGIRLDTEALAAYSVELEKDIAQLQQTIYESAGHEFNIDSPKQLGVVLYEELLLEEKPKKTATGQYSTREAELERLSSRHKIVADILEYRNARKLKSVYVDQLPSYVNPATGRVHTHYGQIWTATGRMQSDKPNLQTIPIRKERGRGIRAAFTARDDDHLLLSADYSQIELRLMAELSGDEGLMEAFTQGIDIHTATAAKVYKTPLEEVTRAMRDKAKMVNFGILYGISAFGLQQRLNIPRAEANELISNYFEKYPGVKRYIDETIAFAKEHGYVATKSGRRRYLREINSKNRSQANAAERLAMNSPIQGTAADMLKLAMIKVHAALHNGGFGTKMLLTVHDEIIFDMRIDEQSRVMPLIEEAMKTAMPLQVPIDVEMGTGRNWLEAH